MVDKIHLYSCVIKFLFIVIDNIYGNSPHHLTVKYNAKQ